MEKRYVKDISRLDCSLFDVRVWYHGEGEELKKALGFGFFETIFLTENGKLTLYYNLEECNSYYQILDEKLDEDFFNELCDDFIELMEFENAKSKQEVFFLLVKLWPALAIFHAVSNYPEYGNDSMLRRLNRIRKTTESFSYELSSRVEHENLRNFVFYKGEVFEGPFDSFIKQNNIIIDNG